MFMGKLIGPGGETLASIAVEFVTLIVYAIHSILDFQPVPLPEEAVTLCRCPKGQ